MSPDSLRAETALATDFVRRYPDEAARALERLSPATIADQLGAMSPAQAAMVLEHLSPETAAQALARMSQVEVAEALSFMDPGRAVTLLMWFEPVARERYLEALEPHVARELRELAAYPPDSAGFLMDPRVPAFRPDTLVRSALARLRSGARGSGRDVLLVDDDGLLMGTVALRDMALASPAQTLGRLPRQAPVTVLAMATRAEVAELVSGRRITSLPVVDVGGRLLGLLRTETLVSLAQEDAGADIQAMVGVSRDERVFSKVSFAVRKRLPWLHINLVTAFVAAAVVGLFEETIARFTALAVLLPVVAGQSGNTGAQALAVTMRGLVLREARVRQWPRIALKETIVALVNGIGVAITTAAGVLLWSRSTGLAVVIGVSMVLSMIAAGLAGAIIPIGLTAAGQDPAQASSIILTTVTDVVGFFSFLGLATLMAGTL